jgi:hypothetical protein
VTTPQIYIETLELQPHPEGGWFKETYRSVGSIPSEVIGGSEGDRNFSTGIYFLLTKENFSAFHCIKSDEMWHFYDGDGLVVHELKPDGTYVCHKLGLDLARGEQPQLVIEAHSWFASEVRHGGHWCLVGCTVSPGFDFRDFEMAKNAVLLEQYPEHITLIERLTRD